MKITGPRSGQPTEGTGDAPDVERSGGKGFASALDKTDKTEGTTGPATSARPEAGKDSVVRDIGQRLESGEITPQQAVDEVVVRVLDNRLGGASPKVRSEVESLMRDKLESDPLLKSKVDSLGN